MSVGNGNIVLLGAPNFCEARWGSKITSPTTAGDRVWDRLQPDTNELLSDVGRSTSIRIADAKLEVDFGRRRPISGVALIGSNLRRGDHWRVRAGIVPLADRVEVVPNALLEATGFDSPVLGDLVQDPQDSGDTSWAISAGNVDTSLRVGFGLPIPGPLREGAGLQTVLVRLRQSKVATPWDGQYRISLWENGAQVRQGELQALSTAATVGSFDTVAKFHFDAAELADNSGGGVEIRVEGFRLTSPTSEIEVAAIRWYAALSTQGHLYDSTQLQVFPDLPGDLWTAADEEEFEGTQLLHHIFTDGSGAIQTVEARYLRFDLETVANPDGYFEAGAMAAGPALQAAVNFAPGANLSVTDHSESVEMKGGGHLSVQRKRQRGFGFSLGAYDRAQLLAGFFRRIERVRGETRPLLAVPIPDDPAAVEAAAMWARIRGRGTRLQKGILASSGGAVAGASYECEEVV